ncbi:MAG: ribonuclease J [Thermoleophilia bacterium]|nr:ribonuclease J [Thermoleophilia bacterium]
MTDAPSLRIIPLGGVGEIGKNMYVVEHDGRMVVIDCGVTFPTPDQLGVDLVLPDMSYLADNASRIDALILTHGHEDHIGAVPWFLREVGQVPILGTRFTLALVRGKLDEHRLLGDADLVEVAAGDPPREVGPFLAEFLRVTHSIPDCVAVALHSPAGTLLHTGDFKFDHLPIGGPAARSDIPGLARLGEKGVLVMLGDSTNADVPVRGKRSEEAVGPALASTFATAPGRVIVTTFSSQIDRMQQVVDAAYRDGRVVAVIGRSMVRNVNVARNLGYLKAQDGVIIGDKEVDSVPDDELVILTTGSQGEPMSALRRMANHAHPRITIRKGDTVVYSSRRIPGNELAIDETINRLVASGARVVTPDDVPEIHASGHAVRDELAWMLQLVRPRFFAPIHGEARHQMAHADLASKLGIPERTVILENGDVMEVSADGVVTGERVDSGITYVDSYGVADVGEGVVRDRRHMSEDGLVLVVVQVDAHDGTVAGTPDVVTRGFSGADDEELIEAIRDRVGASLAESAEERVHEIDVLQKQLHDAIASLINRRMRQRPVILPVVVEV